MVVAVAATTFAPMTVAAVANEFLQNKKAAGQMLCRFLILCFKKKIHTLYIDNYHDIIEETQSVLLEIIPCGECVLLIQVIV